MSTASQSASSDFYQQLNPLESFIELTEDRHYRELPDDWTIVITDVCKSTQAVTEGRYKDVNLIGAATIAAARNVLGTLDFPFVFGGDGASLAVPNARIPAITRALNGLREIARRNFDLELRIGAVRIEALHEAGARVEIAKYNLMEDRCVALFRGGGLTLAERWIKVPDSEYQLAPDPEAAVSMRGLSCRWNAIPSQQGEVLSLLIKSRAKDGYHVYTELLTELDRALGGQLVGANPVHGSHSTYQSIRQCIRQERRLHRTCWSPSYWYRVVEIVFAVLIFRFNLPPVFFDPQRYVDSMRIHADYRKFDDMLRMVIDLSAAQSAALESLLKKKHAEGILYYGLHRSDSSLMTCFVDDLNDGGHIHFIDGSAGGYTFAAKALKAQIAADRVSA